MAEPNEFVFNGVDGSTGGPLTRPMTPEEVAALALGKGRDEIDDDATEHHENVENYLPRADVDPQDLAQAGWGMIFAHGADPKIREALQPLLDYRREQASRIDERRFRLVDETMGYRPDEGKKKLLRRLKAPTSGPVEPDRLPYYLLLVASPAEIPTELQAQLALQYAVGRLCFQTPDGKTDYDAYDSYARSVIASDRGEVAVARRFGLFGVKHDRATTLSAEGLVANVHRYLGEHFPDWTVDQRLEAEATKAQLGTMLGGDQTPAVLFTASHGMGFPMGDSRQLAHQGALLCQDWDKKPGRVSESSYFAGDDVSASAKLAGLIAFFFACYGGGTPQLDAFFHRAGKASAIAPRPFFAQLPTRLLGHPQGGALAVVGHIERAWGCSFFDAKSGYQTAVFESFLYELLSGKRIGNAMERFGQRYGELSAGLVDKLEDLKYGSKEVSETEVANDWTENNDARNYLLLGDPAVRVPVVDDAEVAPRPTIEARSTPVTQSSSGVAQAPPEGAGDGVSYGWFSRDKDEGAEAVAAEEGAPPEAAASGGALDSLRGFVAKLGERISSALDDMAHLEIKTYVTSEMDRIQVRGDDVEGAQLRAYTRIALDGDMVVCLPERDGEIDRAILEIHQRMVQQAQTTRTELMKTIVQAAASLMGPTK
ncbi:MAG: hypothetical protein H6712_10700 [Myxococcales bacterium]|nr:hypothetical protein [Myxococcales bacterium]MCB9714318.1 hypothetical protein [Myxococcales bacterium]